MRAQTLKPDRTTGRGGEGEDSIKREGGEKKGNIRRQKTVVEQEAKVNHTRSGFFSELGLLLISDEWR